MAKNQIAMIVDDDPDIVALLSKILKNTGLEICSASSIEEAKIKLKENLPNFITLDVDLAGINGLNLLKFLKDNTSYSHIPVAVFTAKKCQKIEKQAMELGAMRYLEKPIIAKDIVMAAKEAARITKDFILKKEFKSNEEKITCHFKGDITEINELHLILISPIQFSPKEIVEIEAPFLKKLGADRPILRVITNLGPREGGYRTKITFVGMDDETATHIRKFQRGSK